ncbi:MAG TPA: hypothetical protein VG937_33965 [Polyangiaceae bacterium]|nr:hypothetical protein [Polyangiaceae bacterium]
MRIRSAFLCLGAIYSAGAVGACGSLDSGAINIIDASGGSTNGGGRTGGAGSGSGGISNAGRGGAGGSTAGNAGASGAPETGGQAGAAGEGGMAGSSGAPTGGGSGGPGLEGGAGAGGEGGAGGEAGGPASGCTPTSCVGSTPICAAGGVCRACVTNAECAADDAKVPFCHLGSCVSCLTSADCPATTPVCGTDYKCRTCAEGSECGTFACTAKGTCATAAQTVYALAQTGSSASDCGTMAAPCLNLGVAASKLSAARPHLVLIATKSSFNEGAVLPADVDAVVFGNHVRVAPYDGSVGFTIKGGSVMLDDVFVEASAPSMAGATAAAISCTGAKIKMRKGQITDSATSYGSAGLLLSACDADVQQATFIGSQTGIVSACPAAACPTPSQTLTVERSLFRGNKNAISFDGKSFLIRNNLFLRNGNTSYVDIIGIRGVSGIFAYNTMVGNENNCSYEGGLVSCEGGAMSCGTFSSNLSWNNMLNASSMPPSPCPDQVYYSPPPLTNSLSETTWPGTGNISGMDPKFVDAAKDNYTPGAGSPALNKGSTVAGIVPDVDYYGNPRSRSAPDIGAIEAQ